MKNTATNRRLAQWRVTWLIEHSTSHQLLWCIDSFELRNPPLRQAPNRYAQCYDDRAPDKHYSLTSNFCVKLDNLTGQI
ncbi:hypothetical protein SAMN05444377_12312 [Flavobacterium fontis]|uniref:Uncharacterized protein n=1 Tax=Flavobacterium fontis TaxID=1124188 RepID=A0A1M5EX14_9FLAO|nr:hypothetical protein SAMN05444377_12312 [Flavobacterium fontis]